MTAVKTIERQEVQQASAPVSQNEALIRMIQEAVVNPSIDLDRMKRLFEMRAEVIAEEAKRAFAQSLRDAQAEMKPVVKNKTNTHTRSTYADLEAISEAIQPIITKHGFALTFWEDDCQKPNHIRIACEVMHEAGHSKIYHADVPIDAAGSQGKANKNAAQAYGSTKTYGRRYLKCDIFDIAVKDQDTDGNTLSQFITDEQLEELETALTGPNQNVHDFMKHWKIQNLADLPAKSFKTAMQQIAMRGNRSGANG